MLPEKAERIYRRVGKQRMSLERVKEILEDLDEKEAINTKTVRRFGPVKGGLLLVKAALGFRV